MEAQTAGDTDRRRDDWVSPTPSPPIMVAASASLRDLVAEAARYPMRTQGARRGVVRDSQATDVGIAVDDSYQVVAIVADRSGVALIARNSQAQIAVLTQHNYLDGVVSSSPWRSATYWDRAERLTIMTVPSGQRAFWAMGMT